MIMKTIYIMLLINSLFIHTLTSQTLVQQIEHSYNSLDTTSYIEDIKLSFREEMEKGCKEIDNITLELKMSRPFYKNTDSVKKQKLTDSLMRDITLNSKIWIEKECKKFISAIKDKPAHYILNLTFEKHEQPNKQICLQTDTSKLPFNLFYFDKHSNVKFYVLVDSGKYSGRGSRYITYSKLFGENAPKVFKRILHKNPKYLLYCRQFEGMNTILYVLNDKIYIYRIVQMKEYELDDYIKKFSCLILE